MSAARGGSADHRLSRRALLGGALAGGVGLGGLGALAGGVPARAAAPAPTPTGDDQLAFYGEHQATVAAVGQAHQILLAFDLLPGVDRDALRRMMRLLSDDAARLMAGRVPLADLEGELATEPARLSIAFGFGPAFVRAAGAEPPAWLAPLPAFSIDRLDPSVGDGDLLIDIGSDDPITAAHAVRMLGKDVRAFATPRWRQDGFRRGRGTEPEGTTMRNLFGQVDGTAGPHAGDPDFDATVWIRDGWLAGGTSMVLRRISMDLDGWDELGRAERETTVGRRLADGAPLTGGHEHDEPDLDAVDAFGNHVIHDMSHVRRAKASGTRIHRRPANYDGAPMTPDDSGTGLLFITYQADPVAQYVPMQRKLAELDFLNFWTTPVGSAVFAIPPGCAPGGYIGDTLLD